MKDPNHCENNVFSFFNPILSLSSLTVYRTGYKKCPKRQKRTKVRDFYLIHHVTSGKGTIKIDAKEYEVKSGESYIMFPGIPVEYCADANDPWSFCWVGFNGNDAKLLVDASGFSVNNPILKHQDPKEIEDTLMAIYDARGYKKDNVVKMSAYLYLLFSKLIKEAPERSDKLNTNLFQDSCAYISQNYKRSLSIDEIAKAMNTSRSNLYRVFIDFIGVSPKQHLAEFRTHMACKYLANTTMSIKEIANAVGLSNPQHFDVVFKKIMLMSPTEYRLTNKHTDIRSDREDD